MFVCLIPSGALRLEAFSYVYWEKPLLFTLKAAGEGLTRGSKFVVLGSVAPPLLSSVGMCLSWVFSVASPHDGPAQVRPLETVSFFFLAESVDGRS